MGYPVSYRMTDTLFGVAPFTVRRALFHFNVTVLAFFVGDVLAEPFDFSTFNFFMAFLAVLQSFGMGLVTEGNPFFHFHNVSGKC